MSDFERRTLNITGCMPVLLLVLLVGGLISRATAQETSTKMTKEEGREQALVSAASLVGLGFNPDGSHSVALTLVDSDDTLWPSIELDEVVPIRQTWMRAVEDGRGIGWVGTDKEGKAIPGIPDNEDEGQAYIDALRKAHRTHPTAMFNRANTRLTPRDLLSNPTSLRGEVVRVEGIITKTRWAIPPNQLAEEGIKGLWEGLVTDPNYPDQPYWIVFCELPEDFAVQYKEKGRVAISFEGYYFKRYEYKTKAMEKTREVRTAPLILGRAPRVRPLPQPPNPWTDLILPGMVVVPVVTVVIIVFLGWLFRRGDRSVRTKLAAIAAHQVVIPDVIPSRMEEINP